MRKVVSVILALVLMIGLIGCRGKVKFPALSDVAQMKHSQINAVLSGSDIQLIRDAWGEPADQKENEDLWWVDESMILVVSYDDYGLVEHGELICGTPLAPAGE